MFQFFNRKFVQVSNIMQMDQDDVQLIEDRLESKVRIRNNKNHEFGMPGDFFSLEPYAGHVWEDPGAWKSEGCVEKGQFDTLQTVQFELGDRDHLV